MMTKRMKSGKKYRKQHTNWWLIGSTIGVGVLILFGLMILSFQEPSRLLLSEYCQLNEANCVADGTVDAPVTIIEISDFGCLHCRNFHQQTWPELEKQYVATGEVRWLSLPFALRTDTMAAANASLCAEEQDAYFAFSQAMFSQSDQLVSLTERGLLQSAADVGLDTAVFQQCLNEGRYVDIVQANIEAARQAGVSATPTFFINGRKLEGAYPFSAFQQQIETFLGL